MHLGSKCDADAAKAALKRIHDCPFIRSHHNGSEQWL